MTERDKKRRKKHKEPFVSLFLLSLFLFLSSQKTFRGGSENFKNSLFHVLKAITMYDVIFLYVLAISSLW